MAKLSSKKSVVIEEQDNVVSIVDPIEETAEESVVMTEEEREVIQSSEKSIKEAGASTKRLELATNIVSKQFNLDNDYIVNKFNDKGKVVNLTLENGDFILAITIKDSERHCMCVE